MGLFSSTGPRPPLRTTGLEADPLEADSSPEPPGLVTTRLATTPDLPVNSLSPGVTSRVVATPSRFGSVSSKPLSPDAPTPAVPLASLLEEAQEDARWVVQQVEHSTSPNAGEQELSLYRLAIDANTLTYEQCYTILALTVEFFNKGEHVERVEQQALRTAAGVLLRTQAALRDEPLRILAPFYLQQLRNIFQAWHLYRELVKAIDSRSDFLVRMGGKSDRLIVDSLFSEEGRSMLASRVDSLIYACTLLQLDSDALKRVEWIGKLLMYRTEDGTWQVPAESCLGLCTRLLREINDDTVMGAMRRLALASWEGLCIESNYLRDMFADPALDDRGQGVVLIRSSVPVVGLPVSQQEDVVYFPDHNSFRNVDKDKKEKYLNGFRLVI
jgi:hypothetical protein